MNFSFDACSDMMGTNYILIIPYKFMLGYKDTNVISSTDMMGTNKLFGFSLQ